MDMTLFSETLVRTSHYYLNITMGAFVSSVASIPFTMLTSLIPLLVASIGLSEAAYLDHRQASSSKVADYFQTTPQIYAGKVIPCAGLYEKLTFDRAYKDWNCSVSGGDKSSSIRK
jgi:hypothetical protein